MILDVIILGAVGYVLYAKVWKPTRVKITELQAEMMASWNGICAQIRLRQTAAARIWEMAKAVAPQEAFVQDFSLPLTEQSHSLDDVRAVSGREAVFSGLLASSVQLENFVPSLKGDARWQGAQQAAAQANKKLEILRNQYNGAVLAYNKLFESFPANVVCSICKISPAPLFEMIAPAAPDESAPY